MWSGGGGATALAPAGVVAGVLSLLSLSHDGRLRFLGRGLIVG